MTHFEDWALAYLVNALWQIPLIFAAAWLVARFASRLGARAEHRIWVCALLAQAELPACSVSPARILSALRNLIAWGRRTRRRNSRRPCACRRNRLWRAPSVPDCHRASSHCLCRRRAILRLPHGMGPRDHAPHRAPRFANPP